jgi:hypothetical protein
VSAPDNCHGQFLQTTGGWMIYVVNTVTTLGAVTGNNVPITQGQTASMTDYFATRLVNGQVQQLGASSLAALLALLTPNTTP